MRTIAEQQTTQTAEGMSGMLKTSASAALIVLGSLFSMGYVTAETRSVSLGGWQATYSEPTHRYGHNVLGNTPEWGTLCLTEKVRRHCVTLPQTAVFEDIKPRLVDVDHDTVPEVVVVESDVRLGAALAIYDLDGNQLQKTATPNIGTRYRWLAPIAIGDMNGDGDIDIAYIDRPHLAKTLHVWSYRDGRLEPIASKTGLTNHKIGEPFISGGMRNCGNGPELITADANWQNIVGSRVKARAIETTVITSFSGPADFESVLSCRK